MRFVAMLVVLALVAGVLCMGCQKSGSSTGDEQKGPEDVKAMMQQGGMTAAGETPGAPAKDAEEAPAEPEGE